MPGVVSATLSTHTPLSGSVWSEPAVPSGQPLPEKDNAFFVAAGPRFFSTLGIRLLAGREFTDRDNAGAPTVAIVNEAYRTPVPRRPERGGAAALGDGERRAPRA